jgi:hypothetical protein
LGESFLTCRKAQDRPEPEDVDRWLETHNTAGQNGSLSQAGIGFSQSHSDGFLQSPRAGAEQPKRLVFLFVLAVGLANWRFTEGRGTTATDSSGHDFIATLVGDVDWSTKTPAGLNR